MKLNKSDKNDSAFCHATHVLDTVESCAYQEHNSSLRREGIYRGGGICQVSSAVTSSTTVRSTEQRT